MATIPDLRSMKSSNLGGPMNSTEMTADGTTRQTRKSWFERSPVLATGLGGIAAIVSLSLGSAACSRGSTSHAASPAASSATTAAADGSAATTATTAVTEPGTGGSNEAFCAERGIANPAVDPDNATPGADVASLQKAVAVAPPEIKPDVQTIADTDIPIFEGHVPKDQIDQRVGDPRVVTALRNIAAWSAAHCK